MQVLIQVLASVLFVLCAIGFLFSFLGVLYLAKDADGLGDYKQLVGYVALAGLLALTVLAYGGWRWWHLPTVFAGDGPQDMYETGN